MNYALLPLRLTCKLLGKPGCKPETTYGHHCDLMAALFLAVAIVISKKMHAMRVSCVRFLDEIG